MIVQQTPHNTAEYLKLKYGAAIAEEMEEEPDVIEAEGFAPGERQQISRTMLNQVLQARAEELTELIYNEIRRSGYEGLLPAGIVLTGGTAQLPRLDELMRDMLGIPVRIGTPADLTGLADTLNSPAYATAIGVVALGHAPRMSGLHSSSGPPSDHGGWVSTYERFKRWLKEFLP